MKNKTIVLIVLIVIGVCPVLCTETKELSPFDHIAKDAKEAYQYDFSDYGGYLTSPLRWDVEQWKTAGAVVGITGALMLIDKPLFFSVDSKNLHGVNNALNVFFEMGNWKNIIMYMPTLYLTSLVIKDERLRRSTLLAWHSFGAEILVTQGLKGALNRTLNRNEATSDPFEYKSPDFSLPSQGVLPSGHASTVWAIMTVYADEYQNDGILPYLIYGTATLSSLSLIPTQSHWASDIFLGAAIGYYTGKTARYYEEKHRTCQTGVTLQPAMLPTGPGVSLTASF